MKCCHSWISVLFSLMLCSVTSADWDRFRGPNGSGKSEGEGIPLSWSSSKNIKWSSPIPGKGSSSPIVVGDRVYVTCYTGFALDLKNPGNAADLKRHLIAFDRNGGEELWRATIDSAEKEDPYRGFIQQHGYASSTPTSDGKLVYAFFGKSGLFAFDMDGSKVWQVGLGTKSDPAKWGGGSSPILYDDLVIVNAGVVGNQFVAVDKTNGDIVWKLEDPGFTNCWSTPTIWRTAEGDQLIFNVPKKVIAVGPKTGNRLWEAASPLNDATCASIVLNNDHAYLMGSRLGKGLALRCGGTGDVSETNTVWSKGIRSGINTPLVVGENMYWTTGGIFYAAELKTGDYVYRKRLPRLGGATGGFPNADYSSAVASGENIVLFTRNGESYVIRSGDEFNVVGHNPAFDGDDSSFNASPAISAGQLFVRSEKRLYCIADMN